jgi:hypothetical protein
MTTTPLLPRRARALLAGAAAIAVAAGAAAGTASAKIVPNDPALDVPPGKIEHVVREVTIKGPVPSHEIQDLYLASDKAHWTATDPRTGDLLRETSFARGVSQTFDPAENEIRVLNDSGTTPPWQTLAQEAAIWRDALQSGSTRQIGETTALGRPALVLESVRGRWTTDEPSQVTTMVVDKEDFTLYKIRTVLDKHNFSQTIVTRSHEVLDRTASTEALLAMTAHPGAKKVVTASVKKKAAVKKHRKAARKTKSKKGKAHHRAA